MPDDENLVLRTVYIDADLDDALAEEARASGSSKANLFRRWLAAGIRAGRGGCEPLPEGSGTLVLRTVHVDAALDSLLCVQAFDRHVSRNDVMREYLRLGSRVSADRAS